MNIKHRPLCPVGDWERDPRPFNCCDDAGAVEQVGARWFHRRRNLTCISATARLPDGTEMLHVSVSRWNWRTMQSERATDDECKWVLEAFGFPRNEAGDVNEVPPLGPDARSRQFFHTYPGQ